MRIAGLQKVTLVDYPGKVAATVFTQSCNLACPYCHNPELVLPSCFTALIPESEVLDFLDRRKDTLEGICITGGEPTLQVDLGHFISQVKELGLLVKLDTNGTQPLLLKKLFLQRNIDYVAMDIKAPLQRYGFTAGKPRMQGYLSGAIQESITLIQESGIDYEFRTTVAKPLLSPEDFIAIAQLVKGAPRFYLQNYIPSKQVGEQEALQPFNEAELAAALIPLKVAIPEVEIR